MGRVSKGAECGDVVSVYSEYGNYTDFCECGEYGEYRACGKCRECGEHSECGGCGESGEYSRIANIVVVLRSADVWFIGSDEYGDYGQVY